MSNDVLETFVLSIILIMIAVYIYNKLNPVDNRINMRNLSEDIDKMYQIKCDLFTLESALKDIEQCSNGKANKVFTLSWISDAEQGASNEGELVEYHFTVQDKKDYHADAFRYLIGNEVNKLKAELQHDTKHLKRRSEQNLIVPSKFDFKIAKYMDKHFKDW